MGVGTQRLDFAEFYRRSRDECLRTVLVSMNDDQLTTVHDDQLAAAVKGSLTGVHMNTPLQAIVSRGRMVRARRRIPGLAAALAVLAAAAGAVGVLPPARHPARMRPAGSAGGRPGDGP